MLGRRIFLSSQPASHFESSERASERAQSIDEHLRAAQPEISATFNLRMDLLAPPPPKCWSLRPNAGQRTPKARSETERAFERSPAANEPAKSAPKFNAKVAGDECCECFANQRPPVAVVAFAVAITHLNDPSRLRLLLLLPLLPSLPSLLPLLRPRRQR